MSRNIGGGLNLVIWQIFDELPNLKATN